MIEFYKGDFVVCKKDWKYEIKFSKHPRTIKFTKNKQYEIDSANYWNEDIILYTLLSDLQVCLFYYNTNPDKYRSSPPEPNFYDYFYTKKELRELKIKEIENHDS